MQSIDDALAVYDHTRRQGWWHRLVAPLRGRPTRLLDLTTVVAHDAIIARHYLGPQTVSIEQIRGSEGRHDAFDDAFHPLQPHTEERWLGIATAWLQGVGLPPVDLICVGEIYFVRDGHHRISVLRALGIQEIDAVVTAWDIVPAVQPEPVTAGGWHGMGARWDAIRRWRETIGTIVWDAAGPIRSERCLPPMRADSNQRSC